MIDIVAVVVAAVIGGLGFLAWNHPKAYDVLYPWLAVIAALIGTFCYGGSVAVEGTIDTLRPFLNTDGVVRAEEILEKTARTFGVIHLVAYLAAMAVLLLSGLQFLPRGGKEQQTP